MNNLENSLIFFALIAVPRASPWACKRASTLLKWQKENSSSKAAKEWRNIPFLTTSLFVWQIGGKF